MGLIHADGFDNYTDLTLKYTTGGQTTPSILSTGGRDGRGCFFGTRATATVNFSAASAVIVGFACKMSTGTNLSSGVLSIGGSSTDLVRVHYESDVFSIRNAQSDSVYATGTSFPVAANTWCYIELLCTIGVSIGGSDLILRVNGQVAATAPAGSNTTWSGVTQATYATFGSISGALNPFDCYVDDLVILTPSEGFWGDVTVEGKLVASGGDYSMWTPTGATPNYACVDESNPDDDTTYVTSGSLNARDSYRFGSLQQVAAQIKGVQISLMAEKVGSDALKVAPFFRQAGVNYDQTAISLPTSYAMSMLRLTTNPATGQPWTPEEIDALEAGPKLTL